MTHRDTLRKFLRLVRTGNSGQSLVELALTAPLLFVIVLGAAELARAAYAEIEVTRAAEAAVRYGAQNTTTSSDLSGMQNAAQSDAGNITLDAPSVSTTCSCVDGSVTGVTCGSGYKCASGAAAVETLDVTTSASFDPLIHLPGLPASFTLSGHAKQGVLY